MFNLGRKLWKNTRYDFFSQFFSLGSEGKEGGREGVWCNLFFLTYLPASQSPSSTCASTCPSIPHLCPSLVHLSYLPLTFFTSPPMSLSLPPFVLSNTDPLPYLFLSSLPPYLPSFFPLYLFSKDRYLSLLRSSRIFHFKVKITTLKNKVKKKGDFDIAFIRIFNVIFILYLL